MRGAGDGRQLSSIASKRFGHVETAMAAGRPGELAEYTIAVTPIDPVRLKVEGVEVGGVAAPATSLSLGRLQYP